MHDRERHAGAGSTENPQPGLQQDARDTIAAAMAGATAKGP